MSVYVDSLTPCVRTRNWSWDKSCHLFADDEGELHSFAARLGLKPAWFQEHARLPHYDLTVNMRRRAVRARAQEVDRYFVVDFMLRRRPVARAASNSKGE